MSDEEIVTTLAYSKSPKFSKRTTFQEELQEALFAHAARQNSTEYSDDFESDKEGTIEELPEDVESTPKKPVAFAIPLSSYNFGNVGTLQRGRVEDLASSYNDDRAQPVSMLESEILREEGQGVPSSLIENSGSYEGSAAKTSISFEMSPLDNSSWKRETVDDLALSEDEERTRGTCLLESKTLKEESQRDDSELSVSEEESNVEGDQDQQDKVPMPELQVERNDRVPHKPDIKPVPKPREFKTKTASASAENISIPALDDYSKPSPQPRSMLRKSNYLEDYEGSKAEVRASYGHRSFPLSAPSSFTRLNDQVKKSEQRALSESPGPEGPGIASSSSPFPINFSSLSERTGDSKQVMSEEESSKDQDQKETDNCSDLKLQESGRESPSVIELMMTTVYEKTKKRNKSAEGYLEGKLQTSDDDATEDGSEETTKEDKSEQKVALNVSKEEVDGKKTAPQKTKPPAGRSLSSTYLKKSGKPSIPISTSSQYLGTLKVLDNKHLRKYSAELEKADSLRAAVYQDWLEKKKIFLLELQRIKRNKAENLHEKNEKKQAAKKEEATASFEAWKAMKEKEAKKLAEKKRMEEEKRKKEAELIEKKKEEAQEAAFEKWKEKKAEYLKQQTKREKRVERLKKKKDEKVVAEKKKDSRSAVEKWNEKKDDFMKLKKKEKIQERKKEVEKQFENEKKDKKAIEEYEKWLEKKELQERIQKKQKKLHVILEDEMSPPWSPPGKAVFSRSY